MIEVTYLKEYDNEDELFFISFEGDKEDVYSVRDYAMLLNDIEDGYYQAFVECNCNDKCANKSVECDIIVNDVNTEEDLVNHPSHYTNSGMECILEMVMLYGFEETMSFCKLNAHKYRKRAFHKGGEMDIDKSNWYIDTYKDLIIALETGLTPIQYVLSKMN